MTEQTKFLGVIIEQTLNFRSHISYIKGKISRALGILYKARKFFDKTTLLTLYNSFIHPLFMYCIAVWGYVPETYLDPLDKLQKRAVRIIAGARYLAHTEPLFKELKIMKLINLYVYNIMLIMFKRQHGKLPAIFDSFFHEFHFYDTRHHHLSVPTHSLTTSERCLRGAGVTLYNYFVKTYLLDNDMRFLLYPDR